jgi:hypothetical protein
MSPFVFLLVPVVIIALASFVMWVRGRSPQTLHSGIDGFQREMKALSPEAAARKPRRFEADGETEAPAAPRRPDPHRDA